MTSRTIDPAAGLPVVTAIARLRDAGITANVARNVLFFCLPTALEGKTAITGGMVDPAPIMLAIERAKDVEFDEHTMGTRIAFRSTRDSWGALPRRKSRWTELAVYHWPEGDLPFIAISTGRSLVPGEHDRRRALHAKTLDGALMHFRPQDGGKLTRPAAEVIAQAQAWGAGEGRVHGAPQPQPIDALVTWARQQAALAGSGHIDENHRFKLRDMLAAIDAGVPTHG